jgi:hypothetical protein
MAEPAPQRSLKKIWILVLVIIVVVWVIYAATGGTSTPKAETSDSVPAQQR